MMCRSSWRAGFGICATGKIGSTIRSLVRLPFSWRTSLRYAGKPIPQGWKDHLAQKSLKAGSLLKFSPTGFYSSAVINPFLRRLQGARFQTSRFIFFQKEAGDHSAQLDVGVKGKNFWVTPDDLMRAREWDARGFSRHVEDA